MCRIEAPALWTSPAAPDKLVLICRLVFNWRFIAKSLPDPAFTHRLRNRDRFPASSVSHGCTAVLRTITSRRRTMETGAHCPFLPLHTLFKYTIAVPLPPIPGLIAPPPVRTSLQAAANQLHANLTAFIRVSNPCIPALYGPFFAASCTRSSAST